MSQTTLAAAPSLALRAAIAFVTSHGALTPREREVLLMFLERPCDKAVALRLGTKLQTVKNQLASIQNKLAVSSRAELVLFLLTGRLPRSADSSNNYGRPPKPR